MAEMLHALCKVCMRILPYAVAWSGPPQELGPGAAWTLVNVLHALDTCTVCMHVIRNAANAQPTCGAAPANATPRKCTTPFGIAAPGATQPMHPPARANQPGVPVHMLTWTPTLVHLDRYATPPT